MMLAGKEGMSCTLASETIPVLATHLLIEISRKDKHSGFGVASTRELDVQSWTSF